MSTYNPNQGAAQDPDGQPASADTPPPFYGRKKWNTLIGGLPSSAASTPERTLSFSTTILDSVKQFVYGERKVTASAAARSATGSYTRKFIYIFAYGEQDSITSCEINGESISGLSWVSDINYRYGTGSEAMPTGYTTLGDADDFAKYAYVAFTAALREADVPGSFDVTAVLGGQKVYDWRDTTWKASANPGLIAYDMLTNDNWISLASTRIDTDQWETFTDWCEDTMADATERFAFNGVVYQRDIDAALEEVLGHAFGKLYTGTDGKLKIWSEMDPPAITGEWSASASATITEDSTAGAATTEVEAGDIFYVGTNVRTVVSVTDDDTIVLDSALTVSGVTVHKTSGVYLRKENWVRLPLVGSLPSGDIPDAVIVKHTQNNDWGSHQYPKHGDLTGSVHHEVTANGCTNASQAARTSVMARKVKSLQVFVWDGIADGTASGLEPGDVFFFDTDVLTMQPARVLPPVGILTSGHSAIQFREYDPSVNSISTQADDTPPSIDPGWVTDDPDAPTAATQTFGEAGNWDAASMLPDPDDLTTGQGWTNNGGISSSYSSGDDWTEFTSGGASYAQYDLTGLAGSYMVVTGLARTSDEDWSIQLISNSGGPSVQSGGSIEADGAWHRFTFVAPVGSSYNYLQVISSGSSGDTVQVRRLRAVDWLDNPSLKLYERWDWTEHASASSSVSKYRMTDGDDLAIVLDETPQGAVTLEHVMLIVGISGQTTQWGSGATVEATMYAVGPNGGTVAFPTPTQAIESRRFSQPLDSMRANDLIQSARVGDITNGDYAEFSTSGHLTLTGDATVWNDLRVSTGLATRLGFSDPDWIEIRTDGSGSTGVYGLAFDGTTEEEVFFDVQLPHGWKEASAIKPHVHWAPSVADAGASGVTWGLEYTWANIGKVDGSGSVSTFPLTTIVTASDTDTSFTAKEHRMVTFGDISATGKTISSMLICRLFRDVDDGDDDYADDAIMLEFDIHLEFDSLGSNTVSSKT